MVISQLIFEFKDETKGLIYFFSFGKLYAALFYKEIHRD